MNELVKIENGSLVVEPKVFEELERIKNAKEQLEVMESEYRNAIVKAMKQLGLKKFTDKDGNTLTYIAASKGKRFDSKAFKEEHPDTYQKYEVDSWRGESLRVGKEKKFTISNEDVKQIEIDDEMPF